VSADGIFVQWIQLYEIDINLVSTIFNALSEEFADYVVYRSGAGNVVIIASPEKTVPVITDDALEFADLRSLMERVDVKNIQDVKWNRIASKALIAPMFARISDGINSDYFPILDSGAPRARFTGATAAQFTGLISSSVPVLKFLEAKQEYDSNQYTDNENISTPAEKKSLLAMIDEIVGRTEPYEGEDFKAIKTSNSAHMLDYAMSSCGERSALFAVNDFVKYGMRINALLTQQEQQPLWDHFANTECVTGPHKDEVIASWHALFNATNQRNYMQMSQSSTDLLESDKYSKNIGKLNHIISMGLLGDIMRGDFQAGNARWAQWGGLFMSNQQIDLPLTLILANIGVDVQFAEAETEQ